VAVVEFRNRGVVSHRLFEQKLNERRIDKRHITGDDRSIRRLYLLKTGYDTGEWPPIGFGIEHNLYRHISIEC